MEYGVSQEQERLKTDELNEPLAIIGMNCQFPGIEADIEDVDALNHMLLHGLNPIKEIPPDRWDVNAYYDPERKKADKIVTRKGGFLSDIRLFDAAFFKISAVEAKQIDPQHRLFLQVAVRALNHANISLKSLNGSNTGVYCGIATNEYSQLNYKDNIQFNAYTAIGAAPSAAAGRLSHFLNLKGPSMAVDTACSSSLSALYLAATALRTQQCDLALVGGVHLNLCPEGFMGFSQANMLSATGQCSSFAQQADGFVCSEGCGVVVVQRLSDALKAKNKIYAVLKSIVMNQDGDGTGLTAPNSEAQIAMHESALKEAGLTAGDLDYLEAHGSGTVVGDRIEFQAIQQVHAGYHSPAHPLVIGAVKSTIGHSLSASGMASIFKIMGAFAHGFIPPNLHYSAANSAVQPEAIPALIPVEPYAFPPSKHKKRIVQVNNFSFSGTNVSAIFAEGWDELQTSDLSDNSKDKCFVWSAHCTESLEQMLDEFVDYLNNTRANLNDICCTLINCRDHYRFRCAILASDQEDLIQKITTKNYAIKKVMVQPNLEVIPYEPELIAASYCAGATIKLAEQHQFNRVHLPLYRFAKTAHWHEARANNSSSWRDSLNQALPEEQLAAIKVNLQTIACELAQKELIEEHVQFSELGFNAVKRENLKTRVCQSFHIPFNAELPSFFTLAQLAQVVHTHLFPQPVARQPIINVLHNEPIAIIGMSCRLPKADSVESFLTLLQQGGSGMADIPLERWDNKKYYDADPDALGKLYIQQLGLLDNIKLFDAEFFNVSPREAKLMAPQLRIFMECSYHALEDANLSLEQVKDSNTGVFVGIGTNEYPMALAEQDISLEELNIYYATGNVLNAVAGRVAYSFDFHGPIQVVDTACSSSMTAIHNACLSLQAGDCTMALAGGINILLSPASNITLSKAKMLSPESRCKTFSDDADGYARSEGCGVLVLKRLSDAVRDNDTVLTVIKGSAVNSDGKSGGFTVPNGTAQKELIYNALAKAHLSPADIDYIEAHGTGTPLADPIEANTLMDIFAAAHSKEQPLYLSSVKTNIGHAESASGVAGLIKAVLSVREQQIFKHLNFKALNPEIALKNTVIPMHNRPWPKAQGLRAAGVSSFGFSGANAHIIIQEVAKVVPPARTVPAEGLLLLSAKSHEALELLLARYYSFLSSTKEDFSDICYTAATCRSHFLFRVALLAPSAPAAALLIKNRQYTLHVVKKEQPFSAQDTALTGLKESYQQGIKIDWQAFYLSLGGAFKKVALPLYQFARKEYWYGELDKIKDSPLLNEWCFQLQWQAQPCDEQNSKDLPRHWLLLGETILATALTGQGLTIQLPADSFPTESLDGIIFALPTVYSDATADDVLMAQRNTLKTLLLQINQLNKKNIKLPLLIVTSQAVTQLKDSKPAHAALLGFCKTLVLELPEYQTIVIDTDECDTTAKAALLCNEIRYNHGLKYEHVVAYRGNKRLVSRLKRAVLKEHKPSLYGNGRYLITGGTGGLGLISAQALLSAGAKEVILVARNLAKEEFKKNIQQIESYYPGRIIRTLSLDITDKNKLATLLAELNTDGLLKGIIHAAGAAIKAPLIEQQEEDIDYLFAAKVKGAWNLHELSQGYGLDFFIVYSSISAVFGSNKESVYSGANSSLDSLIAERHRLGLVGTSVQWGPWGEVGMAKKRSRDQNLQHALISNGQGHRFIKALIINSVQEITIIAPAYLQFMLDFVPQPAPLFYKQLEHDLIHKEPHERTVSTWLSSYVALNIEQRVDACKQLVTALCKQILELSAEEELDEQEGFFAIGFDSLMIAELASELRKKLEPAIKIMVSVAFNYPTINKLAHHLATELNTKVKEQRVEQVTDTNNRLDDIAVIGLSCSLPQAPNLAAFEHLLAEGLNAIKEIPQERWDNSLYYNADVTAAGASYVRQMGLLEHIKEFDAAFFGISPREARFMDPQQRLFLECCYTAIEHANYPLATLKGSATGVFAGVGPNEYFAQLERAGFSKEELSAYSITGNVLNLIAGRVAYTFDLKGPSLSIDTACSSSLVALHYACQSLKSHEIDYALAGGVNVLLSPESNITLCKAHALSPTGQCHSFDQQADGYVRAEGCGVVLLKRLSDALRDKDSIWAVIKASAVNHDGKSAGLTVPSGTSQEELMRKALQQAHLSAADISYIEAHGTGTPLGDPIEVHAINEVYGKAHTAANPLYLATVKTNIGHLESASGIAALIKAILSLKRKKIYKHLNFKQLNANIDLKETRIPLHNMAWNTGSTLRTAAVNAFGFSGTNAHVIVQEYTANPVSQHHAGTYLLVLSAQSQRSLEQLARHYQEYLAATADDFANICFTAATCREHYAYRLAIAATTPQEAMHYLINGTYSLSYGEHNIPALDDAFLQSLLLAYLKGKDVDWRLFYDNVRHEFTKVHLPTYSFARDTFWLEKEHNITPNQYQSKGSPLVPLHAKAINSSLLSSLKEQTPEMRRLSLADIIRDCVAEVLEMKVEQIDVDADLFTLGLDSLMAVELRNKIHDALRYPALSISMEYFLHAPRIETIAHAVATELETLFNQYEAVDKVSNGLTCELPLSDVQYNFWALNQYEYAFNLGIQFRLQGRLHYQYFERAFALAVQQHGAFWIDFNAQLPLQTLKPEGLLKVLYDDKFANDKSTNLDELFHYNRATLIPLNQQPLIRIFLYKINDQLHEIQVIIPHIIAEGRSCDVLMEDFRLHYEALIAGTNNFSAGQENNYFRYVQHNNADYAQNIREKEAFWRRYNKAAHLLFLGRSMHVPDAAVVQEHYLSNYALSTSTMEHFISWHKSKNFNVSSGLIALCHIVFYVMGVHKKLPLTLIHTGREGSEYKNSIGLFAEYKRINSIINEKNQFIDCIEFIEEQLLLTAAYQKFPSSLKGQGAVNEKASWAEKLFAMYHQLKLNKRFKQSTLHPVLIKAYIIYFSGIAYSKCTSRMKQRLNLWFGCSIPLQPPMPLHTLISITPSFFVKQTHALRIADLHGYFPHHYAYADRPVGNRTLWIYFSKDQQGEYQLSLNGPLTKACKDEIAFQFKKLMATILSDDSLRIRDLQ